MTFVLGASDWRRCTLQIDENNIKEKSLSIITKKQEINLDECKLISKLNILEYERLNNNCLLNMEDNLSIIKIINNLVNNN